MYSIAHIPLNFKCRPINQEFLTKASKELSSLMPEGTNFETNNDLFGVVFDAAVIGIFNANDDGIDAVEAIEAADTFIHKPCNYAHDSNNVVGHIINYGFTQYGGNKIFSPEEALEAKIFDISLASVIYKRVYSWDVFNIIRSTDPDSDNYMGISASWEVGFSDYDIAICDSDEDDIYTCERISSDNDLYREYSWRLRANGGSGRLRDGRMVKRILKDATFLGIGFTENPAADVEPIQEFKPQNEEKEDYTIFTEVIYDEAAASELYNEAREEFLIKKKGKTEGKGEKDTGAASDKTIKKTKEIISFNVNTLEDFNLNNMNEEEFIKFLEENNVAIEKATASSLFGACTKALQEGNQKYLDDIREKEEALSKAKKLQEEALAKIKGLETQVAELQQKQEEAQAQEIFNQRMSHFEKTYKMDDAEREVIAKRLSAIASEEDFKSFESEMSILWKNKTETPQDGEDEKKKLQTAKASIDTKVPNSVNTEPKSFRELAGGIKINIK